MHRAFDGVAQRRLQHVVAGVDRHVDIDDVAVHVGDAGDERDMRDVGANGDLHLAGQQRAARIEQGVVDLPELREPHGDRALHAGGQVDQCIFLRRQRTPPAVVAAGQAQQQRRIRRLEQRQTRRSLQCERLLQFRRRGADALRIPDRHGRIGQRHLHAGDVGTGYGDGQRRPPRRRRLPADLERIRQEIDLGRLVGGLVIGVAASVPVYRTDIPSRQLPRPAGQAGEHVRVQVFVERERDNGVDRRGGARILRRRRKHRQRQIHLAPYDEPGLCSLIRHGRIQQVAIGEGGKLKLQREVIARRCGHLRQIPVHLAALQRGGNKIADGGGCDRRVAGAQPVGCVLGEMHGQLAAGAGRFQRHPLLARPAARSGRDNVLRCEETLARVARGLEQQGVGGRVRR